MASDVSIVHTKKYQVLMRKMGEHVQASPSLLNIKLLFNNVAETLNEIPNTRLGSFEVSAVCVAVPPSVSLSCQW